MFIDKIEFTKTDLELVSGSYQTVAERVRAKEGRDIYYRPQSAKFKNDSGGIIDFCLFTEDEYDLYLISGSAISDLYPVENSEEESFSSLRGNITKVFAKGRTGESFTSGASCLIIQE